MTSPIQKAEQTATSRRHSFIRWLNPANVYAALASLEARSPVYTAWKINPVGTAYHIAVGATLGVVHRAVGVPVLQTEQIAFTLALGHEWGDGDLWTSPGHPFTGLVDILSMMVGAAVAYL